MNGAEIFARLFPLANDGARTWTLGAWLDAHREEVVRVGGLAIQLSEFTDYGGGKTVRPGRVEDTGGGYAIQHGTRWTSTARDDTPVTTSNYAPMFNGAYLGGSAHWYDWRDGAEKHITEHWKAHAPSQQPMRQPTPEERRRRPTTKERVDAIFAGLPASTPGESPLAVLQTLQPGERIFVTKEDSTPRPFIVLSRRRTEVKAESETNGAPVTLDEDSVERGQVVIVSGAGVARVVALGRYGAGPVAVTDSLIGLSWPALDGDRLTTRTVARPFPKGDGTPAYEVRMEGSRNGMILTPREIEQDQKLDAARIAYAEKMKTFQTEDEKIDARNAATRAAFVASLDGFEQQFTPLQRAKVIEALAKPVSIGGVWAPRGETIRKLVESGRRVETMQSGSVVARKMQGERKSRSLVGVRVLASADGFYEESDLTKTGIDYAIYVAERLDGRS